jgi:hypothetical protein
VTSEDGRLKHEEHEEHAEEQAEREELEEQEDFKAGRIAGSAKGQRAADDARIAERKSLRLR